MAGRARFNPIARALSRAKLRKSPPAGGATRATGGPETASGPPPSPEGQKPAKAASGPTVAGGAAKRARREKA